LTITKEVDARGDFMNRLVDHRWWILNRHVDNRLAAFPV